MQITGITLTNVRRFTDPVTITGLGPGLNVLSEPNEAGKSTLFDALQAVFFRSHRSFDKGVKALVPRVGGDPEVSVRFRMDGSDWRIAKCWSGAAARKSARLWRDETLVAQGEDAETQLASMIGAGANGGPAGLLWVRQGVVAQTSDAAEQAARRGILDSVAGEVEAMTGGHRMAQAIAACDAVLSQHMTSSGRVAKNGGLAQAQAEVDALDGARAALSDKVATLQDDLDHRRRVQRELAELTNPQAETDRQNRLRAAQQVLADARARQSQIELAAGRLRELDARAAQADQEIAGLRSAIAEQDAATQAMNDAQAVFSQAETRADAARHAHRAAQVDQVRCAAVYEKAREQVHRALQLEAAQAAQAQRLDLSRRIAQSEALRSQIEAMQAKVDQEISVEILRDLERLEQELTLAQRARDAAAARLLIQYEPEAQGQVVLAGRPLEGDQSIPIPDGATLDIPGVGKVVITPGAGATDADVTRAEQALGRALATHGLADPAAARASAARHAAAAADARAAVADLNALAPDGLADLHSRLAALPAEIHPDPTLPPKAEAEAHEAQARAALDTALARQTQTQAQLDAAETARRACEADRDIAAARLARADQALASVPDPQAALADQLTKRQAIEADIATAREMHASLTDTASDLEAAQTAAARAVSVIENSRRAQASLREDLAKLNARIGMTTSEAPEEELALICDQLQAARSRLAAIQTEVAVNQRLRAVLTEAQAQAREAYVQPVHVELAPLLRMLWPDAVPEIDAETGLITALTRRDVQEDIDVLSGGTQEQISLLVRLAFARLLADRGQPAPVILDDAIVYTDDDRIEQIFNALTARSDDLQIIVLSCRQRAFRALGGRVLQITPAPT